MLNTYSGYSTLSTCAHQSGKLTVLKSLIFTISCTLYNVVQVATLSMPLLFHMQNGNDLNV